MRNRQWRHPERAADRQRGSFHRGHLVRKSKKNDRQRYDFETVDGASYTEVEDSQPIGFTSNPSPGDNTEVIVAELGGEASRMVVVCKVGNSEYHLQVEEGAAALYSPDSPDQHIIINKEGLITIKGAKELRAEVPKCVVDCPDINLGGEGGVAVRRCDGSCATRVKAV